MKRWIFGVKAQKKGALRAPLMSLMRRNQCVTWPWLRCLVTKPSSRHITNTAKYRPLAVVSAACAPPFATIGPVTTKVYMVPMVPQVRIKLTSFGEETLVCSEPRVISVV